MKAQINSGCCVPFFTDRRYQSRYDNDQGHEIVASSRFLIPFIFWQDAPPAQVDKFRLLNIETGAFTDLDTALITVLVQAPELDKTYYFFTGEEIWPSIVPCGTYEIIVRLNNSAEVFSDVIHVKTIGNPETVETSFQDFTVSELTVKMAHVVNTVLRYYKASYQVNGAGAWTPVTTTRAGAEVTFPLPIPIPDFGAWLKVRYVSRSDYGYLTTRIFVVKYSEADAEGSIEYELLSEEVQAGSLGPLYEIRFENSADYNGIIYAQSGVKQSMYLPGYWGFPEPIRTTEFEQNGEGVNSLVSSQTRLKQSFTIANIPDQFLQLLSDANVFDRITIIDLQTGKEYPNLQEVEFSPQDAEDGYFSTGVLKFQTDYAQRGACVEEITVEVPEPA